MIADWERAKEIFAAALELPVEERDSFVHTACNGDDEAIRQVQELLQADGEAGSFLDPQWLATAFASPASIYPGDRICERYRIIRLVAEGGMGRVYEAHDEELNTRIALKAIHPEIASVPGVLARFRQEVRIAHRITHPHVCRTFHMDRETRRDSVSGAITQEIVFF
jgi:eukaryotic-like serine/threonine-protein kinase